LTVVAGVEETADEALLRGVSEVHRLGAEMVRAMGFGGVCPGGRAVAIPRGVPFSLVEGAPCHSGEVAGVNLTGVRGCEPTIYETNAGAFVSLIEDSHARRVAVTGISAEGLWADPGQQAAETFRQAESALGLVGMTFRDVYRTWLFLDDILSWYDDLNRVRSEFFHDRGVFDGMVPASTGIGAANPRGAAITMDLLAMVPLDDSVSVQAIPSPLQCPALEYGSSFSRAVEVTEPDLRSLLVSGTASIEPGGGTIYGDDVVAQVDRTLDVIEAILTSRDMDWGDVTRAVAYFRYAADAGAIDEPWRNRGGHRDRLIVTESTICRDDLLFELEIDAVRVGVR